MNPFAAPLIFLATIACTPGNQPGSTTTSASKSEAPQEAKPAAQAGTPHAITVNTSNGKKHTIVLAKKNADDNPEADEIEVDGQDMSGLHDELIALANNGELGEQIKAMVAQGMAAGMHNGMGQFFAPEAVEYDDNAAFFGIGTEPVSPQTAAQLPLKPGTGLVVTRVVKDSPAAKAGLQPMDILARLGDQMLVNAEQFAVLVRSNKPGDSVTITFLRGGKELTATVQLTGKKLPKLRPGGQRADAGFNMDGDMMMFAPGADGKAMSVRLGKLGAIAGQAQAEAAEEQAAAAEQQAEAAQQQATMIEDQARLVQRNAERSASQRPAKAPKARPNSATTIASPNSKSVTNMRFNNEEAEIVWTERNDTVHIKIVDHKTGKTVYDADSLPDEQALASFRPEVRSAFESFPENGSKVRSKQAVSPAEPPVAPAPPAQPAPPTDAEEPSVTAGGSEEPLN